MPLRDAVMRAGGVGRVVVDRDPPVQDLSFFFKAHDLLVGRLPVGIRKPGVVPHVQLLHVQRLHAEILERLLGAGGDVLGGKHFGELVTGLPGPLAIHRRDLGCHGHAAGADLVLQLFPDHALGMAVAVRQRGVARDAHRNR